MLINKIEVSQKGPQRLRVNGFLCTSKIEGTLKKGTDNGFLSTDFKYQNFPKNSEAMKISENIPSKTN